MDEVLAQAAITLGHGIPTEPDKTWELLWETDKLRFRVIMALTDAQKDLSSRRLQVLLPKDPTVTDLDRTTTQEAGSADQAATLQRLQLTLELLNARVDLLRQYVETLHTKAKEE
jgi:hypothetical protein